MNVVVCCFQDWTMRRWLLFGWWALAAAGLSLSFSWTGVTVISLILPSVDCFRITVCCSCPPPCPGPGPDCRWVVPAPELFCGCCSWVDVGDCDRWVTVAAVDVLVDSESSDGIVTTETAATESVNTNDSSCSTIWRSSCKCKVWKKKYRKKEGKW